MSSADKAVREAKSAPVAIPDEWLNFSARHLDYFNRVAGRDNLVFRAYPGAHIPEQEAMETEHRTKAWYSPHEASLNVNADLLVSKDTPLALDLTNPMHAKENLDFVGASIHECAHAAHTTFRFPKKGIKVAKDEWDWAMLLEESRAEANHVKRRPQDQKFLRPMVKTVVMNGLLDQTAQKVSEHFANRHSAVRAALLVLARVDSEVMEESDVATVRNHIETMLTTSVLDQLRQIWLDAHQIADGDLDSLLACGAKIAQLLRDTMTEEEKAQEEALKELAQQIIAGGNPQDGEGGGEAQQLPCGSFTEGEIPESSEDNEGSDGQQSAASEALKDAIEEALEKAKGVVQGELAKEADNTSVSAKAAKKRKEREEEKKQIKVSQKAAQSVFRAGGKGQGSERSPIKAKVVRPSAEDRRAVSQLTKQLRKARHRDVTKTLVSSTTPPGRLQISQIARRDAQLANKSELTATPWKQTRRRVVEQPPLTVGISVDVSASMEDWQRPVSSFAWAVANAVKNLEGKVAAVAWNGMSRYESNPTDGVHVLMHAGRVPKDISVMWCGGGSTGLGPSLSALEGELDLLNAPGVRVIVMLTDGGIDYEGVQQQIDRFKQHGILPLYIKTPNGWGYDWKPSGTDCLELNDPANFGSIVGKFIADALSKHGREEQ